MAAAMKRENRASEVIRVPAGRRSEVWRLAAKECVGHADRVRKRLW